MLGAVRKSSRLSGKDLDGKEVNSSELFSGNTVTVVNFWFTTCKPCVGELADLDALNQELAQKGGAVVGINAFTLDGDEGAIAEAKEILSKKRSSLSEFWFDSDSDAGPLYCRTVRIPNDLCRRSEGNIVGQPIVGAVTSPGADEGAQCPDRAGHFIKRMRRNRRRRAQVTLAAVEIKLFGAFQGMRKP